eukprot:779365-Amorphochlora_amoeboformis.AAC.1
MVHLPNRVSLGLDFAWDGVRVTFKLMVRIRHKTWNMLRGTVKVRVNITGGTRLWVGGLDDS